MTTPATSATASRDEVALRSQRCAVFLVMIVLGLLACPPLKGRVGVTLARADISINVSVGHVRNRTVLSEIAQFAVAAMGRLGT
jgi:hypothetical protein